MYRKITQRTITTAKNKALLVSLLLSVTAVTTGCSSLPETITGGGNQYPGYTSYDPCIRCGESWVVLPNEYMNALKTKKRWDAEREGKELPKNQIDVSAPAEQPKVVIIE